MIYWGTKYDHLELHLDQAFWPWNLPLIILTPFFDHSGHRYGAASHTPSQSSGFTVEPICVHAAAIISPPHRSQVESHISLNVRIF